MFALGSLAMLGFVFSFLLWRSERGPKGHGLDAVTPASAGETPRSVEPS
jgi:hypothetical protein